MDDVIAKVQREVERRLDSVRMIRWSWEIGPVFVGTDRDSGELKYAYRDDFFGELMIVSERDGRWQISVCIPFLRCTFRSRLRRLLVLVSICRCCTRRALKSQRLHGCIQSLAPLWIGG